MSCALSGFAILTAFVFTQTPNAPPRLPYGDTTFVITVGGVQREYILHVPPSYNGSKPFPVVLVFHGAGSDARAMVYFCGLNQTANSEGFLAVYPNGTGPYGSRTWNAGFCCGEATEDNVDDVTFVRKVLNDVSQKANVDGKRIYATGISNGGMMCYRLANEMPQRIAAIAPVGGMLGSTSVSPQRPVSVMHFHGTADRFVPFALVPYTIQAWVQANSCSAQPVVTDIPDTTNDGMTSTRTTYGSGKKNSEVILVTIEGGGHTWPGRPTLISLLGPTTTDFSANDLMWTFFKSHRRN